jgi:primosomal replication protein N
MRITKIKTIGLGTIQTSVIRSDIETARQSLAFAIGASVDVSGVVLKRVKRSGECKLVINPDNTSGLTVFADCLGDEKTVITRKLRKGSLVQIHGRLLSFGANAVCLSDAKLK